MRSALRWALVLLALLAAGARAEMRIDTEAELRLIERGERVERHIADARYRVAVFSFQDPDGTGLGEAAASVLAREILLSSRVSSIGVLRYEGSLAPAPGQPLSYFDKVDQLVEAQDVSLAVWGAVRREGTGIGLDTWVQIPRGSLERSFTWSLRLPAAMGQQRLVARLRPDRLLAQSHEAPPELAEQLRAAARSIDQLRAAPREEAALVGRLPQGSVYWVEAREGDWIRVSSQAGSGWVRSAGHCGEACAPFLAAGRFVSGLLGFMQDGSVPEGHAALDADVEAARAQMTILRALGAGSPGALPGGPGAAPGPGAVPYANMRALHEVAVELREAARRAGGRRAFDGVRLDPERLKAIAAPLARASLEDPGNADVLNNLAVLFRAAGDAERAALAERLALEAGAKTR